MKIAGLGKGHPHRKASSPMLGITTCKYSTRVRLRLFPMAHAYRLQHHVQFRALLRRSCSCARFIARQPYQNCTPAHADTATTCMYSGSALTMRYYGCMKVRWQFSRYVQHNVTAIDPFMNRRVLIVRMP